MAAIDGAGALVSQTSSLTEGSQDETEQPQSRGPKRFNWDMCMDWPCEWHPSNPKRPKSQAALRWSLYSGAATVSQALQRGATFRDLDADHARNYLKLKEPPACSSMVKKESTEETIEREKTRRCRRQAQPVAKTCKVEKSIDKSDFAECSQPSASNRFVCANSPLDASTAATAIDTRETVEVGVQASTVAEEKLPVATKLPKTIDVGVQTSTATGDELAMLTHETYRLRELLYRHGVPWGVINEASMGRNR